MSSRGKRQEGPHAGRGCAGPFDTHREATALLRVNGLCGG